MKIIFSRKGFDSQYGGIPSPILPDGSIYSLPIPSDESLKFSKINYNGENLGILVEQLSNNRIKRSGGVHLDPDIRRESIKRRSGWMPSFGQANAAQSHLDNQKIEKGDIFLFFGWFRKTKFEEGILRYDKNKPAIHLMFGWLQIGEIYKPTQNLTDIPKWAEQHAHVKGAIGRSENNTLYVATKQLKLKSNTFAIPGGGIFRNYSPSLVLSKKGENKSTWKLPTWFYPFGDKPPLSYHSDKSKWKRSKDGTILQTVAKGQEFVLNCDYYPESYCWLLKLFKSNTA